MTLDALFPHDRVLDVQITVDKKDRDAIGVQRRDLQREFAPERKLAPIKGTCTNG